MKEIFSYDRILTDIEADNIFQEYLEAYQRNWKLFPDRVKELQSKYMMMVGRHIRGETNESDHFMILLHKKALKNMYKNVCLRKLVSKGPK